MGRGSWMRGTMELLYNRSMIHHWYNPEECASLPKDVWKDCLYASIEAYHDQLRESRMSKMSSLKSYITVKQWNRMSEDKAEFKGEVWKLGALVCERYLDDMKELLGSRLKLMCRAKTLPVLARIAIEEGWKSQWARCMMCDGGEAEDMEHLLLNCPCYKNHRDKIMREITKAYSKGMKHNFNTLYPKTRVCVLLGADAGTKAGEDSIDHAVKRFLKKAWRTRRKLTTAINREFERKDIVTI